MEKYNSVIIGVAIIWAAVILAAAMILQGTGYFSQMLPILGGGAASSIIVLGGARSNKKVSSIPL
jgi:hypothetical protein